MHRHLFIVVAILLLAAAVRIINVSGWPASTDEGWTYWAVSDHHTNVIIDKIANDRHPPLYFLMFSAWSTLTGDSRLALRYFGTPYLIRRQADKQTSRQGIGARRCNL